MVRGMGRVYPKIPRCDVTLVPNFCLHNQTFLSARSVYVRKMSSDLEMSDLGTGQKVSGGVGGGPEQRGGGSSVFEPLTRGGSFNFQ